MSIENGDKGIDESEMARYLEKNEICRNIQALSSAISGIFGELSHRVAEWDSGERILHRDLRRALKIEARVFLDLENMSHGD